MELINLKDVLTICFAYCPDDDGCCSKAGHDLREMLDEIEELPIVHIDDMAFHVQNEIQAKKPSRTVEITFVRHGRWIVHTTWHGMFGLIHSECSECKFDRNGDLSSWKFCPNCGSMNLEV